MDLFGDLPEPSCICNKGPPVLRGYVGSRRGERDEMQDFHVLLPNLTDPLTTPPTQLCDVSYFAVFDGHRGERASRFAAEHLHLTLAQKFPRKSSENLDKLIKKCLLDSFRQTDDDFLKKASSQKPVWKDGCTATCLLVVHTTAYVANLGDSRAVLCRVEEVGEERRVVSLALSREHNPTLYEERIRIQRAGGTVREGRVLGILEVSRSLGDGQYKRCGVISTPDLRSCTLTSADRYDETRTNEEGQYEAACQRLASEAVRRGCADNVTVILVSIGF
ncbi:hypothetical protein NHX12_008816 [Muraenolepis orangiensis]|uniref:PPM-type phosphatase domain-containing protein n=1 Tax=Muraenolepis orangiensis TaxID=630683 RepID=A0A9Q0DNT8_9TELE|nr:hypothetical protein NHX12_008816 [Muraenolepis orangiensis]